MTQRVARKVLFVFLGVVLHACTPTEREAPPVTIKEMSQQPIKKEEVKNHSFLPDMYQDEYFPDFLIDKGKAILINLCLQIERQKPTSLEQLYTLTHAATERFNDLQDEFFENGSELETGARESIAAEMDFIAKAYGFNADVEELIAPREW